MCHCIIRYGLWPYHLLDPEAPTTVHHYVQCLAVLTRQGFPLRKIPSYPLPHQTPRHELCRQMISIHQAYTSPIVWDCLFFTTPTNHDTTSNPCSLLAAFSENLLLRKCPDLDAHPGAVKFHLDVHVHVYCVDLITLIC